MGITVCEKHRPQILQPLTTLSGRVGSWVVVVVVSLVHQDKSCPGGMEGCTRLPSHPLAQGSSLLRDIPSFPPPQLAYIVMGHDSCTQPAPPHTPLPSHPRAPKYTSSSALTPPPALPKPDACSLPRSPCLLRCRPPAPRLSHRDGSRGDARDSLHLPGRLQPISPPATRLRQCPAVRINAPLKIQAVMEELYLD